MSTTRLGGVIAAIPTPVTEAGEPDTGRFLHHARWLLANGCDGLNVLGTTGEANSFSEGQRRRVMDAAASGLDRSRLMVGTGAPDLTTTIALTRHAHDVGFAGALVLPPYYYKNVSDDGLAAWFARLVEAIRNAPIPIYIYNFPQMTGITLSPQLAARLKAAHPDHIAGAKDSSGDLAYAAEIARIADFDVFPSSESAIGKAGADGYAGCISATVSVTAPLVARYWRHRDDPAIAAEVGRARSTIASLPLIPAVKYLVARLHDDRGFEQPLPPHLPLTAEQKSSLAELEPVAA